MLYIGVTSTLHRRVYEHKHKLIAGFSQLYNLHRLVYFEVFGDIRDAIAREKQLKGWLRSKKVALINSKNPRWQDLAADWYKPLKVENTTRSPERPQAKTRHPEAIR